MNTKYPVYVISKGRSDCCLTARFLVKDGVEFRIVVEPQEAELYAKEFGKERILILPFSNLGLGSIPARNWVWEHSKKNGARRHWILDDNIRSIIYRYEGYRIRCDSGKALHSVELFCDQFKNIGIIGLNYSMFAPDKVKMPPYVVNCHVYSALLIDNSLDVRWRGRYNEDTDLCLQVLSKGLCTVLTNCFLIDKTGTMKMKGGNTAELYKGDGRLKMARSLQRVWPHIVQVRRRFKRPQHVVNWSRFRAPLIRKAGVRKSTKLEFRLSGDAKSPELKRLLKTGKKPK